MNDWFEWNGTRCTEYGIHVLEQPPITIPSERAAFTSVPGRSGSLTTLEGDDVYDDLLLMATCFISDPSRIPEIAAWLRGSSRVTFANRQGGFYYARIVNQISFEKILRGNPHRSFAVNFRCKPFWYAEAVQPITLTTSGTFVSNPGSVASEPVITVYGSGEITLMVGMTVVELEGVMDSITLDTPLMEAYKGVTSMNGCTISYMDIAANTTFGTSRIDAYEILENTLNLRDVRIFDTVQDEDGKERRVLNSKETTLAQQKQQAII